MKFKIIEKEENKITQPKWDKNGGWSSPSSVEQWVEENPKFDLFLQYYKIREMFIDICKTAENLWYSEIYENLKNKPQIIREMFLFLNNITNIYDQTPLSTACYLDDYNMTKLLLENNGNKYINLRNTWDEKTPLELAYSNKNYDIIKLLLKNGAKITSLKTK